MSEPSTLALVRLLQLASPALPVGAYTYSQGLEWAVESGRIHDEESAGRWIGDLLLLVAGRFEAPLLACLMRCWKENGFDEISRLNADFLASRESAELRAESLQMGFSLLRLLAVLDDPALTALNDRLAGLPEVAFPVVWAGCAVAWGIDPETGVCGYLWSWAENQVMAAIKAVPLGQAAGQRLLAALGERLPAVAREALRLPEDQWANLSPTFALCCARHETQYSRLFRS
ncbi:urease accessory protein UreF [Betaproteobacteria bacterium]|nr:urease accessory protein UreF [Betaproteobacteria bacterium]